MEEDFNDYEYQSLDYDYYYDQLVPEHERFFQVHFGILSAAVSCKNIIANFRQFAAAKDSRV